MRDDRPDQYYFNPWPLESRVRGSTHWAIWFQGLARLQMLWGRRNNDGPDQNLNPGPWISSQVLYQLYSPAIWCHYSNLSDRHVYDLMNTVGKRLTYKALTPTLQGYIIFVNAKVIHQILIWTSKQSYAGTCFWYIEFTPQYTCMYNNNTSDVIIIQWTRME